MRTVRITSDEGMGTGTKIFDVETGEEIRGVQSIDLKIVAGEPNRADVRIFMPSLSASADASYKTIHPKTGQLVGVRTIVFTDGEVLEMSR